MYGSTALNWFGSDPRPDYYRYLPSFSDNDPEIVELWRNKDPSVTQIDWDKLYYANLYSCTDGDGSAIYLVEDRRSDLFEASFNASLSGALYGRLKIDAGIGLRASVSDQYKTVDDLLGAKFVLDIDKFAERDFPTVSDIKQNDLNHPQRKAIRGSVFGYDFLIDINSANFWIQNRHPSKRIDFHYGTKLTYTEFRREGKMRNGRYPNDSYGKGAKHSFVDMAFKCGANIKISGRHFITLNMSYASEAPLASEAYISPRISDKVLPDLKSGKIFSSDVNYIFSLPAINGRVSVFRTNFNDRILRQAYYSDSERTFVNHVMGGLNKVHQGVEFGAAYKPDGRWSFYLVGTLAEYYYANNPEGTICYENAQGENMIERVYLRNYYVGGTPQKAVVFKVGYFYKYRFFNFCVNGTDGNYVDIATIKRLVSNYTTVTPKDESYEAYKILTSQERFKASFTLDLSVGKILYLPNKSSIVIGLTLNNVLNDKNIRATGYEQGRLDLEAPRKFAAKYYYMQGINGFLNISYRFN
jgi:hypothetical protein